MMGARIKELRKAIGLTQDGLARAAGMNRVTIARYEVGAIQPNVRSLKKLAMALRVPVTELIV